MKTAAELVTFVETALRQRGDAQKAAGMAAYMKTDMPFYGVQKPARVEIQKVIKRDFRVTHRRAYERAVLELWKRPHREEKYIAIYVAALYSEFITAESLPLYERLIREGAWWDFVDEIAIRLVGTVLLLHRPVVRSVMDEWIADDDLWIRRSAIIAQIKHKEQTDHRRLFRYCRQRAHETEFFIRKGIGWALRQYSYAAPTRVRDFLTRYKDKLSPLSYREGARVMVKRSLM